MLNAFVRTTIGFINGLVETLQEGAPTSLRTDAEGAAWVRLSQAATVSGAVDTELPAAAAPTDVDANGAIPAVLSRLQAWTGSAWERLQSVNGILKIQETGAAGAEDNANGVIAVAVKPLSSGTYAPSLSSDFGTVTKKNAKSTGAGNVLGLVVTNANASARWFQLHNTAGTPAGGAAPIYSFYVPGGGGHLELAAFFAGSGGRFATGIAWAWSTTAPTFTDAATPSDHTTHVHFV